MAGLVGPLLAAVLMPVSSLTVVLSSALTRTFVRRAGASPGARARAAPGGGLTWRRSSSCCRSRC